MLIRPGCFNTYLFAGLLALLAGGCVAPSKDDKKVQSALRLHLEVNPNPAGQSMRVNVGRSDPLAVNVEQQPFLTELQVEKASVLDALGGYAIAIQFKSDGAILLEKYTGSYKGRQLPIAAKVGG